MEKKNIRLSVAIAVYNEATNIDACLSAVSSWVDEIVVVDGGSTDETVNRAKKYTNIIIQTDNPSIFHINKQKALDACRGEWILQLDADEVITEALKLEILQTIKKTTINGYYIPRRNNFWGHFMKKGGQYPDNVIRLIRKGKARFPCKNVHEQIEVDGAVGYLKEPMLHYSYRTSDDYWKKAETYTTLTAIFMKEKNTQKSFGTWVRYNVTLPIKTFLLLFIRHKGFVDGWYGFVFAYWSALHYPIAYRKFIKMV
jgi:glycosyltransferase involved in cell wall biosynthesis